MKKLFLLLTIPLAYLPSLAQCSFTINQVVTDVSCEYGNNGGITANPTGGVSPYTVSLNGGIPQATGSFNGLSEGNYTLNVSDASTCTDSVVIMITHNHAAPVLSDPPDQIVCNNTATLPVNFLSNIPGTSFSWTNNNPSIGLAPVSSGNAISSFIAINNGTTPVVATITVTPIGPAPDFCVGLSQSFTITVLPDANMMLTSATGSNSQTVCSGNVISNIVYTLGGSATNATVSGLPLGVTSSFAGGTLTIAGFSGPYGIFTYTVTTTGSCASATATGTIQSMPLSSSAFSYSSTAYCQSGTNPMPNMIATPGGTFSASSSGLIINAATGEIDLMSSLIGGYMVKYVTPGPCVDSSIQSILVTTPPSALFGYPNILFCSYPDPSPNFYNGASAGTFSSSPAGLVFNSTATGSIDLSASIPGTYTVINSFPAVGGCAATSAATYITINASVSFMPSVITNGCSCNGNDQPIAVGGLGGLKYYRYPYIGPGQWDYADSIVSAVAPNNVFNNLCSGTYTLLAKDAVGCTAMRVDTLLCNLQITNQTNPTCTGLSNGEITVNYGGGITPYTFVLNPGNIIINAASQTATYTNLAATGYTITATDGSGATLTNQTTLVDPPALIVMSSTTPATCGQGGSIICTSSGPGPFSYTIFPVVSGSGIYTNVAIGSYTITVSNSNNCTASTVAIVSGTPLLTGVAVTDSVYDETCYYAGDGAIDLTPSPSAGLSYVWNNGDTTQDLANIVSGTYTVKISNSVGDCIYFTDSVTNIGNNCGSISGKVYADSNSDCVFNGSDLPLQNIQLQLSNGALAFSNLSGDYVFNNVPYGNYTISQILPFGYFANACSPNLTITLSAGTNNITGIDFIDSASNFVNLGLFIYGTSYIPGSTNPWVNTIDLCATNYTQDTTDAVVSFLLNDSLIYNTATPLPSSIIPTSNGDSLIWYITIPAATSWGYTSSLIHLSVHVPSIYPAGLFIQSCGDISPVIGIDSNLSNNYYCITKPTAASYDPNDKTVSPLGIGSIGGITTNDSILDYVVRFQNTGTAEAMNIKILDTLSSKVNINTFEVLASSHSYMVEVLNGNILQFKFNDINLPDSNANEPLSHGFIAYRIHQKTGNVPGDEIKNTASIYFDFNSPVVTNTTLNTIITPTAVNDLSNPTSFLVYPSPVKDELNIIMKGAVGKEIQMDLINAIGRKVKRMHTFRNMNETYTIQVSDVPVGYYVLKITNAHEVQTQKILIAR